MSLDSPPQDEYDDLSFPCIPMFHGRCSEISESELTLAVRRIYEKADRLARTLLFTLKCEEEKEVE